MSKPIQDGGELDKAKEGDGEFVVACGHPPEAFESGEEVFDPMAAAVVAAMEGHGLAAAAQPSNANPRALTVQLGAKVAGIKTFVSDHALAPQRRHQRLNGFEVMPVARSQAKRHGPPVSIDDGRQLGVDAALTAANRLLDLAPAGIGAVVMYFDVRTIHVPEFTARSARQRGQQLG